MKKIILLCAAGMSTSLLVNKMRKAALEESEQYDIEAYPIIEAAEKASDADVILLGPQVRFQESQIKMLLPDRKVAAIDISAYGTMNGKLVLEQAKKIMEITQWKS